jgi:hypothetical protein
MSAHETNETRELTVCELDQVSGGEISRSDEVNILWAFKLTAGFYAVVETGTLNGGLHR